MAVPALPLANQWTKDPVKVHYGTAEGEAKDPPAAAPFQVGSFGPGRPCDPRFPATPHAGGMLVALADGSVRSISRNISQWSFWAATTPAGNETPGPDWQ